MACDCPGASCVCKGPPKPHAHKASVWTSGTVTLANLEQDPPIATQINGTIKRVRIFPVAATATYRVRIYKDQKLDLSPAIDVTFTSPTADEWTESPELLGFAPVDAWITITSDPAPRTARVEFDLYEGGCGVVYPELARGAC